MKGVFPLIWDNPKIINCMATGKKQHACIIIKLKLFLSCKFEQTCMHNSYTTNISNKRVQVISVHPKLSRGYGLLPSNEQELVVLLPCTDPSHHLAIFPASKPINQEHCNNPSIQHHTNWLVIPGCVECSLSLLTWLARPACSCISLTILIQQIIIFNEACQKEMKYIDKNCSHIWYLGAQQNRATAFFLISKENGWIFS